MNIFTQLITIVDKSTYDSHVDRSDDTIYNNEKTVDAVDDGLYSPPTYYTSANYANKLFF